MAQQSSDFYTVFDLFMRSEVEDWRVAQDDAGTKVVPFSPLTLLESFIASEVPVGEAFKLFDDFRRRAATRFTRQPIRLREIHALVTEVFLESSHPLATVWLSNYENVFAPELDLAPDEPGFIYARRSKDLDAFLSSYLQELVNRSVPHEELRPVVERLVHLVRVCGFYKVPTDFLTSFVQTLTQFSSKANLSLPTATDGRAVQRLGMSHELLTGARVTFDSAEEHARGLLKLAVHLIGSSLLLALGLIPRQSGAESLLRVAEVVDEGQKYSALAENTVQPIAVASRKLQQRCDLCGLRPQTLAELCLDVGLYVRPDLASRGQKKRTSSISGFLQAVDETERLLDMTIAVSGAEPALAQALAQLQGQPLDPGRVATLIRQFFQGLRLQAGLEGGAVPALLVELGTASSRLRDYGRGIVLFITAADLTTEHAPIVTNCLQRIRATDGMVGILVSPSLNGSRLPQKAFDEVRAAATRGVYLVPMGTSQLAGYLVEARGIFDRIVGALEKTFDFGQGRDTAPSQALRLPASTVGYDRNEMERAWYALPLHFRECIATLQLLLEDLLELNCTALQSFGRAHAPKQWKSAVLDHPELDRTNGTGRFGISARLEMLAAGATTGVPGLKALSPSTQELKFLHEVRRERNKWAHRHSSVEEARSFFDMFPRVVAILGPGNKSWDLVAIISTSGRAYLVSQSGNPVPLESGEAIQRGFDGSPSEVFAFAVRRAGRTYLSPVQEECGSCGFPNVVRVRQTGREVNCAKCGRPLHDSPRFKYLRVLVLGVMADLEVPNSAPSQLVPQSVDSRRPEKHPIRVFVSYSHNDRRYLGEDSLLGYLRGLELEGVEFWHDERIVTSGLWDDEVRLEISRADIALVLVSQQFLNSPYIRTNEVSLFLEQRRSRGMRVFPVVLSACDWRSHTWLSSTQFLPRDGKNIERDFQRAGSRKELYLRILSDLRSAVEDVRRSSP